MTAPYVANPLRKNVHKSTQSAFLHALCPRSLQFCFSIHEKLKIAENRWDVLWWNISAVRRSYQVSFEIALYEGSRSWMIMNDKFIIEHFQIYSHDFYIGICNGFNLLNSEVFTRSSTKLACSDSYVLRLKPLWSPNFMAVYLLRLSRVITHRILHRVLQHLLYAQALCYDSRSNFCAKGRWGLFATDLNYPKYKELGAPA